MQAPLLPRQLRRVLPVLLAGLLVAAAARAQPEPLKLGQVARADLTAAPFVADSAANAVVLCDFGRSRLRGKRDGFEVVFERTTRLKILKKAGYGEATVEIPLYHSEGRAERITNLRGFTHNLVNGAVEQTRLEAGGAFLEKRTAHVNVQKFTLPNVREGAVIEYSYTLTSDFLFNFQDWAFQRDIPVRWSEYRVSIPVFYRYKMISQGSTAFDVDNARVGATNLLLDRTIAQGSGLSAGQTVGMMTISAPTEEHQWVRKNVPALQPEPYTTAAKDYEARIDFELVGEQWPEQPYRDLMGSWDKISARLLADEDFGGRLGSTGVLRDQLSGLAAQHPGVAARAAAVRQVVLAAVRYDGKDRLYAPEPLRKALDARRGTSADVNLLLIAALREAGLPAHPLLLSTRDHGRVNKEFPLLERFNYVMALVPLTGGKDLLLDATEPLLPSGVLPERCLNQTGRLIMKTAAEGRWVDLTPTQRHVRYQQVAMKLDAQGGLTGTVHEEHGGYAAADARAELAAAGEKKYLAKRRQRHESWAVPALRLTHAEALDQPLVLDYEFSQAGAGGAADGPLYLSPLSEFGADQNPFRRESRAADIDFGCPQDELLVVTLTLPAGYELAEVPKSTTLRLPGEGGLLRHHVAVPAPGVVQLTSRLTLANAVYAAADYAGLRELYRQLLARQSEKLVIQKKAGG